jgi:hypothetical protein
MMLLAMHVDSLLAVAAGLDITEPTAPVPDASKEDAFVVLRSLLQAVAWLGPQLTAMQQAKGQAGVYAVLLEQQAQIQASLEQIQAAGDVGGSSSSEALSIPISAVGSTDAPEVLLSLQAAVSPLLAQQLADFAAALSGCFPAKLCCNAPGCSNLAERSELEAVRGKSCICGGCKVAR